MTNVVITLEFETVEDAQIMLLLYRALSLNKSKDSIGDQYCDKDIIGAFWYLFDVIGDTTEDNAAVSWLAEMGERDRDKAFRLFPGLVEIWEKTL